MQESFMSMVKDSEFLEAHLTFFVTFQKIK